MPYVAHYYPASDAGRFFRVGSTIEIAGPLFTTYADAAAQLAQELEDIDAHSLPVSPYILQVEPQRNGFRIVEAFDAEVGSAGRARNPRREGARMTPIGELIGDRVQMYEPRGIEVGPRQQEYEPTEAADVFGGFMADAAPRGVSARRIAHAFHTGITPPKVLEERADQRDAKEKAIEKVARQVDKDVQTLGVTGAIEKSEEKLAAIVEAVESGQITKAEAAVPIAVETKKQEILAILNRFCPTIGEEGTEAIYEVVKATLGGDPDAAEASRVILEKVGKRVTGRPVKVVTGEPKPKGKGKKAVAQIAGGVAPFNGDVTAFVKANGHYFTGMPTGLVGKVIDNALGVSPFPVDHPIAQLRQVSEAAYRLLRDADVFKVSSAFNNEPQELETQIVAFPSEAAAAPLAAVVAEQIAELPPAAQDEVIAEVEEAAAEAEEFEDAGADTHTPAVIEVYRENVDKAISGMSKIAVKQSGNKTDENAWFAKQKKLQAAQKMLGVRGADSIPPASYYSRFEWLLALAEREKELRAQGQTPWWRGGSIGVSFSQLVAQAEAAAEATEVPQPGGATKRVFDEAVRIVGLPYREAERALESSSYSFEALYDALEDRNWHTEIRVLQALAAPMRLARPNLWKAATELVAKKDKAGSLTPALRKERDALDEKIAKYQKVVPIVAVEAPAQPLAEVVAEQVAELPRAEREEVAAEVAAAPAPAPATRIKVGPLVGSYESIPPMDADQYTRKLDYLERAVNELSEEIREMSVQEGGVSMSLMGKSGQLKLLVKKARPLARKPAEGVPVLDELDDGIKALRLAIAAEAEQKVAATAATRRRALDIAEASRTAAPAPAARPSAYSHPNLIVSHTPYVPRAEREPVAPAPAPVAARENTFSHMTDGITGVEVPWYRVPLGNDAFQYALGVVQSGDIDAIYRRSASQRGTYGGWRWETNASKLIPESTTPAPVVPLVPAVLDLNRRKARIEKFVSGTDGIDGISVPQEFLPPGINLSKMRVAYGYTRWKGLGVYTQFKPFKYGDEWDFLPLPPDKLAPIARWAEQYWQPSMPVSAPVESAPVAAVEPDEADVEFSQFNEPQVAPSRSRRPSAEPRAARTSRIPRAGQPGLSWATPQVIAADAPSDWAPAPGSGTRSPAEYLASLERPKPAAAPAPAIVTASAAQATDDEKAAERAKAADILSARTDEALAKMAKMFGL